MLRLLLILSLALFCSALQFSSSHRVSLGTSARVNPATFGAPVLRPTLHMCLQMSSTGGSTKQDTRTASKTAVKPSFKEEIEKDWRLILHDDTVHTIAQVCNIVSELCPLCPGARAYEVTLEVHMTGAGTVAVANKKIITEYTKNLQAAGLTCSMAPDDDFEGAEGGDEDDDDE
ncbi:hypothetical protein B484DRAFT_450012 [Ochromonadaceae sp. CCMP2298]|nr:hypothetical protein B484DRAFT_450012 [Ochromonadaceae sp. CCMP2298]